MTHDSKNNNSHPKVLLYAMRQASLIVKCKSSVVYKNQAGGYSCSQRQTEGILVPLVDWPLDESLCPLDNLLSNLHWGPVLGIDEERACEIDDILAQWKSTSGIKVDRAKLDDSEEAWIHVKFHENDNAYYSGFSCSSGVLVWSNSD